MTQRSEVAAFASERASSNAASRSYAAESGDSAPLRHRTYSHPKVIHERRGVTPFPTPQSIVNNFGGVKFFAREQLWFWLNREVGHAGFGRRIPHSNVVTFFGRCSLRALRPAVKEYSEPFARKVFSLAVTNSISPSIRQGRVPRT